ncbi:hypothetical protein BVRB_4g092640 [Beta vulgaris subsp. vulgaris]|nr:hypothetical protein BVRB_4g092640 [Beta vulgaris subsp. vulgaris]
MHLSGRAKNHQMQLGAIFRFEFFKARTIKINAKLRRELNNLSSRTHLRLLNRKTHVPTMKIVHRLDQPQKLHNLL